MAGHDQAGDLVGQDTRRQAKRADQVVATGDQVVAEDRRHREEHQAVRDSQPRPRPLEFREIEDLELARLGVFAAQEVLEHERLSDADDAIGDAVTLEDLERDRLVLAQEVDVLVDHPHEPEVVVGLGDREFVVSLFGQGESLGVRGARRLEVVRPVADPALRTECADAHRRVPSGERMGQQLLRPRRALGELRPELPEAPDGGDDAEPDLGFIGGQGPAHRGPHVVLFVGQAIEPGRRVGAGQVRSGGLGEVEEGQGVAALTVGSLARPLQPLGGELVQQRVALEAWIAVFGRQDLDEALVRQRFEPVDDQQVERTVRVDDVLGTFGVPAAAEDGTSAKDRLLVVGQEVVAPGDRSAQGPLALRQVARPAREQVEAGGEAVEDRLGAEHPDPRRGELDREGQAFEAVDDAADGREVGVARHGIRADESGPVEEQLGRRHRDRAAGPRTRAPLRSAAALGL